VRKIALPLLLICGALMVMACSSPADAPARQWIKLLQRHGQKVKDGEFKAEKFKSEGEPIVEKLRRHVDFKEHKLLLTDEVLAAWTEANTEFENVCTGAGNQEALDAYRDLAAAMMKAPDEDGGENVDKGNAD
jgi:hypothetical protein